METAGTPKLTSIFRPFMFCPWLQNKILPAVAPKVKHENGK